MVLDNQWRNSAGFIVNMKIKPGSLSFPHVPLPLFAPFQFLDLHFLFTAPFELFPSSLLSGIAQMLKQWSVRSLGGFDQLYLKSVVKEHSLHLPTHLFFSALFHFPFNKNVVWGHLGNLFALLLSLFIYLLTHPLMVQNQMSRLSLLDVSLCKI